MQELISQLKENVGFVLTCLAIIVGIALLAKLASQASSTGDEEIVLNARDKAEIGAAVVKAANALLPGGKLTLSDDTGDFKGGLILRRGSIEANCTVELLVELCRGDMSAQLAGVLFE